VLVLLLIDLGRPDRFYFFLFNINVHSPLFEICWCILLYSCVLTLEASPMIFDRLKMPKVGHAIHKAIIPIAIAAVTLSSLHQSTLGTLYLNMPYRLHALWYTPVLPLLFFTSSVVSGLSMAILMYLLASHVSHKPAKPGVASGLAKGVAGAGLMYLLIRVGDIVFSGKAAALFAFDRDSLLVWFELALLAIVPLIMFLNTRVRNSTKGQAIGAGLAALGLLVNRFDSTLFAQTPPSAATYVPHIVEWVTTIGIVAAAALVWYLGVKLLSVVESAKTHAHD
jgi:Ni/Fe-hydrogenase subunit HybB-like protein